MHWNRDSTVMCASSSIYILYKHKLTASEIVYAFSVKIKLVTKIAPERPKAPGNPIFSTNDLIPNPDTALVILVKPLIGENHLAL